MEQMQQTVVQKQQIVAKPTSSCWRLNCLLFLRWVAKYSYFLHNKTRKLLFVRRKANFTNSRENCGFCGRKTRKIVYFCNYKRSTARKQCTQLVIGAGKMVIWLLLCWSHLKHRKFSIRQQKSSSVCLWRTSGREKQRVEVGDIFPKKKKRWRSKSSFSPENKHQIYLFISIDRY